MSAATLCICGCKETKKISTETQNVEVEKESETETEKLEEETQTEASNIIESESQQEEVTSLNQELLSYNLLSLYINEINKSDNGYEINADVYEAMLIKCDEAENLSEGSILEFGDNTLVVEEIERAINNDYRSVTLSDVNEDIYQYYFEIDGNYDFVDKNGVKFFEIYWDQVWQGLEKNKHYRKLKNEYAQEDGRIDNVAIERSSDANILKHYELLQLDALDKIYLPYMKEDFRWTNNEKSGPKSIPWTQKVELFSLAEEQGKVFPKLLELHLQPAVASCIQEHYVASYGCKMTQYIQRELFLLLQMSYKLSCRLLPFLIPNGMILYKHCHKDFPYD